MALTYAEVHPSACLKRSSTVLYSAYGNSGEYSSDLKIISPNKQIKMKRDVCNLSWLVNLPPLTYPPRNKALMKGGRLISHQSCSVGRQEPAVTFASVKASVRRCLACHLGSEMVCRNLPQSNISGFKSSFFLFFFISCNVTSKLECCKESFCVSTCWWCNMSFRMLSIFHFTK